MAGAAARLVAQQDAVTLAAAADAVAALETRALELADEVDERVSVELARLPDSSPAAAAAAAAAAAGLAGALGRAMLPPPALTPPEVNAWWRGLDAAACDQLIAEFPARIGWLNGLPAAARNSANRLAMARDAQRLGRELADLQAQPPSATAGVTRGGQVPNPAYQQWLARIAGLQSQLIGIASLERAWPWAVSSGTCPRTCSASARPGTAAPSSPSVTLTLPPSLLRTSPASAPISPAVYSNSARAVALWQRATTISHSTSLASVYWLDYRAPQLSPDPATDLQIGSTADAIDGAQSLAGFQAGLAAAHAPGAGDRTMLLGHSYGTLVVGEAAARDGVRPNDIIFVAVPALASTMPPSSASPLSTSGRGQTLMTRSRLCRRTLSNCSRWSGPPPEKPARWSCWLAAACTTWSMPRRMRRSRC